jgi:hypothetical protein
MIKEAKKLVLSVLETKNQKNCFKKMSKTFETISGSEFLQVYTLFCSIKKERCDLSEYQKAVIRSVK